MNSSCVIDALPQDRSEYIKIYLIFFKNVIFV